MYGGLEREEALQLTRLSTIQKIALVVALVLMGASSANSRFGLGFLPQHARDLELLFTAVLVGIVLWCFRSQGVVRGETKLEKLESVPFRLSSPRTASIKNLYPLLALALVIVVSTLALKSDLASDPLLALGLGSISAVVCGFVIGLSGIRKLADEVTDYGEYVRIRNKSSEVDVPISHITDVQADSMILGLPVVRLRLSDPGGGSRWVSFLPNEVSVNGALADGAVVHIIGTRKTTIASR